MKKNIMIKQLLLVVFSAMMLSFFGCQGKAGTGEQSSQRGEPVIIYENPIYDEASQTFTLTVSSDSTAGANVTYSLLEGDSVIMSNSDGRFSGIPPFDEGYNVTLEAQWDDTTLVRTVHIMDFVVPRKAVEKMTNEQLQNLINSCDQSIKRGTNEHLTQGVKLTIRDSKSVPPRMLPEVVTLIENGVWKSIEVINIEYDDNNLITAITLKPVGEHVDIDEDDEDLDY